MVKNWLIRTKSNHILGPVSKEKIIELYQNGSIRPEDEVCSGNGYWFFMREKELVESYILGSKKQSFNPISEARDVLTADRQNTDSIMEAQTEHTLVGKLDLSSLREPPAAPAVKVEEKKKLTEEVLKPVRHKTSAPPSPPPSAPGKIKKKLVAQGPIKNKVTIKERKVSDRFLMVGTVIVLLALAGALYFRKRLATEFLESAIHQLIPVAHAQDLTETSKKKTSGSVSKPLRTTHSISSVA
ncbi:MAG: hypothetical protein LW878_01570 [Proteobacteria bacterium]|jgi:hypothetical protein|nr:hypothetical protein [Pseudomonadota bacterium]